MVDVMLIEKGNSNSGGVMPVHLIITMMKWIRLSIKNSLCDRLRLGRRSGSGIFSGRCVPKRESQVERVVYESSTYGLFKKLGNPPLPPEVDSSLLDSRNLFVIC